LPTLTARQIAVRVSNGRQSPFARSGAKASRPDSKFSRQWRDDGDVDSEIGDIDLCAYREPVHTPGSPAKGGTRENRRDRSAQENRRPDSRQMPVRWFRAEHRWHRRTRFAPALSLPRSSAIICPARRFSHSVRSAVGSRHRASSISAPTSSWCPALLRCAHSSWVLLLNTSERFFTNSRQPSVDSDVSVRSTWHIGDFSGRCRFVVGQFRRAPRP
jgi:hypothetical protein